MTGKDAAAAAGRKLLTSGDDDVAFNFDQHVA